MKKILLVTLVMTHFTLCTASEVSIQSAMTNAAPYTACVVPLIDKDLRLNVAKAAWPAVMAPEGPGDCRLPAEGLRPQERDDAIKALSAATGQCSDKLPVDPEARDLTKYEILAALLVSVTPPGAKQTVFDQWLVRSQKCPLPKNN